MIASLVFAPVGIDLDQTGIEPALEDLWKSLSLPECIIKHVKLLDFTWATVFGIAGCNCYDSKALRLRETGLQNGKRKKTALIFTNEHRTCCHERNLAINQRVRNFTLHKIQIYNHNKQFISFFVLNGY